MTEPIAAELFEKIIRGDRVALGRGMTLVESDLDSDREMAVDLLERCEATQSKALKVAISGAPGVGKSTLIEVLGLHAINKGLRVGVITIDPSSTISHGSILGDKSRMTRLSVSPEAYIRSSAAGTVLGGMGRRTLELMTLLTGAGYDIIVLETVGVGQSEHLAWQFTDCFILVIQPGGGDELQGIKRGITELADIIVVNKADGPLVQLAKTTKAQYQQAQQFFSGLRPFWTPKIVACSALENHGVSELWDIIRDYSSSFFKQDTTETVRNEQHANWLDWSVSQTATRLLTQHPAIQERRKDALYHLRQGSKSRFRTELEIEQEMKTLLNR